MRKMHLPLMASILVINASVCFSSSVCLCAVLGAGMTQDCSPLFLLTSGIWFHFPSSPSFHLCTLSPSLPILSSPSQLHYLLSLCPFFFVSAPAPFGFMSLRFRLIRNKASYCAQGGGREVTMQLFVLRDFTEPDHSWFIKADWKFQSEECIMPSK